MDYKILSLLGFGEASQVEQRSGVEVLAWL